MAFRWMKTLAFLLLHITGFTAVLLGDFYPYGTSEGDTALPSNDDGSSGVIPISSPFPYFDQNHGSLYVNTNGVVSFLEDVSQYTPDPFPLGDNRRLISPFWGDVDTRNGGFVTYRETTDTLLLQRATDDVRRAFLNHQRFQATWIFIATWDRVAFFGASGEATQKVNTFQTVLATNGRHSFAIFNYNQIMWTTGTASGGDDQGLGGTPAQGGFNAGDGIRFFVIPGSRTNDILNLPSTSNVARDGQWMFQTDEATVEAGGCDAKGSLTISPRSGMMLGGTNIKMSGPCFTAEDVIVVQFDNELNINATFGNELQSTVTVPVLNKTGRLPIKLSVDGGHTFKYDGVYTSVAINRHSPSVERSDGDIWQEDSSVDISWDSGSIGGIDDQVSIELARYKMDEDEVPILDSFHTTVESQSNTGHSQFTVTRGEGDGEIDDRFVNLVRVSRKDSANNSVSQAQWVWSDVFTWNNAAVASERCERWHQKEPNPDSFKDPSLQPCPLLLTQAMADRGRYMSDEMCNPLNQAGCSQYHKGAAHCFTTVNPSAKGAAQQCCYNNFGNLMMSQPNAGSLDRVHPNAGLPVISHFFHDIVPFRDCCRLSDDCEKYFEKRPSDDGSQYQAPRPATGFGDPHMVTLDGTPFTFNGYGEYVILKVSGVEFTLQGRMEPLMGDDGVESRATVYTAFAAKENGSDTVQIHLNGRGMVDVLVSGEKANFDELSLLQYDGVSVLQYANTSKFSAIFDSGISVTVDGQQELLGLVTLVPTIFKGNTSGLLGYWDDNQEQEFLRPDGTFLKTNSSLEDIHTNFGQLWVTSAQESLFIYQQGKSHSTYHQPEYVPIFPDTQSLTFNNKSLEQEAQSVCGENKECMFDIYTTGKVRIGRATKETVQQFVAVVNDTVKPACVPLNARLPNGVLLRNDTEGGLFYKFTCNRGFVLNGSSHVTCKDGVYNGSAPNCLPRECTAPGPSNITNGYARGNGSVYRSMYHYTCNDGYVLVGQDTIVCTEYETWNGTEPKCLKECPKLQAFIPNGSMSGSGSLEGSLRKFGCNAGYWLVGRDILYCTEEGKWNASFPSCLRECPTLPSLIANGYVNGSASVEGSYYRFSCKKGYLLSGADTLHCSDEGKWSGSVPTCLIECPQLPSSIPNGNISGSGSVQGSLYRFDCKQGYALVGQSSLLCTEKGSWNASIPSCLKECPTLPSSVPNGHVNSSGSVEGSQYRFSCKTGYSLVGEGTLYCSREGTWNGSVPTCLIECPQLPASLNNGHMNGSGYVQGSLYRFSCIDGYSLVGQNTLYCSAEGKWNASTPSCLKECSSLPSSIPNGYVNGSGSLEGSHYRFSCKKGFSLVGADTLYCSDEGKWNGSLPACLIECPVLPLSIANGYINGSGHVEDSYYRFSCNKGFSLVGADILLCTDGGTWNGSVPTCLIECLHLPLSIPNGFINGSGSVRGSQYRFSCKDGYSLVGRDNLYCTEQGSWNASIPSCLKECPVLPSSITNGYVNESGSLEGSYHRFSCNKGFSLVGADTLHCSDAGKWNGSLPTCLIECPVLPSSLTNGYINGSGHVEGSHYRSSCKKGFSLVGADTLYCSDKGTWNGSLPACYIECPVLPSAITNGYINGSGSIEGSFYRYRCNKGFSLVGADTLYCSDAGKWNGSLPTCLIECPVLPSSLTNGYINGNGHVEGSYYRFTCNKGFSLMGAGTLHCSEEGKWNGSLPSCLKGCPVLPSSITNGYVNGSGSVEGSHYSFSCNKGFSLVGADTLYCTDEGMWNGSIPSCLKECPSLPSSITNGHINGNGSIEGSHYKFTCNKGFSLVGADTLYCSDEGTWNGSVPTCLIGCPRLSLSFPNGVVTGSGSVHGSLYRFRCKDGYSLIGWSVVSCTHQGIWNASIPSCLKECPPLQSSITNGFVNGSGAVEGSHYRFTCSEGFSLMGADTLYCTGNGSWNGSAPTCLTVSVRQEATEVAWYVYASSGGGALVFILVIVSLVVLLWRLRKSRIKQHEHEGGEELEMKPNKTQDYLAVRRFSDPTPIAV